MGWFLIVALVASFILQRLMAPKPPSQKTGGWRAPTAEAGRPIPAFFGTVELGPNAVWFGGVRRKKRKDFTRWYCNFHLVMGWGIVNEIIDLSWDDKSARKWHLKHSGTFAVLADAVLNDDGSPVDITINGDQGESLPWADATSMFGGDSRGGGVAGLIRAYWGTDDQPIDAYLSHASVYGPDRCSRWPRIAYLRMGGSGSGHAPRFYQAANAPQPYALRVLARRNVWWSTELSPLGQTAEEAAIRRDANFIEVMYELITNQQYGLGRPTSRLDMDSFRDAAAQIREEQITDSKVGFGVSVPLFEAVEAASILRGLEDCGDAVLATSPVTGLLRVKLIRADYEIEDLPVIDASVLVDDEFSYTPALWAETVNEVKIKYQRLVESDERMGFVEDLAVYQDLANFRATGRARSVTIEMPFITDADVANLVVNRVGQARSIPLAKAAWKMNRTGRALMKGDPVLVAMPEFGVENLVMRVTKINYGTIGNSAITVDAVQDVFSVSKAVYRNPPVGGWEEPAPDDELGEEDLPTYDLEWGDQFRG